MGDSKYMGDNRRENPYVIPPENSAQKLRVQPL